MNYLIFNKTCVIDTPIEGNNSMVRSGGTSFNENDPFVSFTNALLHSTMKKYGSVVETERMTKIQKLKDDVYKKIKNGEKFKQKLSSFLEIVKETLSHFYKYLISNDFEDLESNKKFSNRLLNDGEQEKIQLFKLLSEIITLEDFNKIFKMTEKKWISNDTCCIFDYNKIIQKETVRFLMYQEFFEDVDKKKSDFFVQNIISMINELVKISFEKVVSDEKNFLSNCITKEKIDILSNYMDLNIVFLDYQTRQPFFLGTETNLNNNKKTVIIFSFDLKHFEIVGKHLPDDRIQRNFMPYDDIVKNIIYYSSMKSAVNIGPVKKNVHSDEKKIEVKQPPHFKEEEPQPPIEEEEPTPIKEEEPTPIKEEEPAPIKEEKEPTTIKEEEPTPIKEEKEPTPIEQIENVEKNIKENIYYNSDDEMLRDLGDSL